MLPLVDILFTNINIVESRWDAPPGGYIVTNINIVESRWDAPPGGYVSVEEQEVHITKKEQKIAKKAQV